MVTESKKVEFRDSGAELKEVSFRSNFFKEVFLPAVLIVSIILLGGITGWFLSKGQSSGRGGEEKIAAAPGASVEEGGEEIGLEDPKTFRDSAKGTLEEGGVDGEGTHHLVREGGPSQNVYLTSSVIDLSGFEGREVEVWGETFAGQKAGWLMDVGRIKVVK